jgi:hypothetical protein
LSPHIPDDLINSLFAHKSGPGRRSLFSAAQLFRTTLLALLTPVHSFNLLVDFMKKKGMPWPQYFDGKHWNNEISFRFGINSVPTQWLVDKKGILRQTNARFNLEALVEQLLKEE